MKNLLHRPGLLFPRSSHVPAVLLGLVGILQLACAAPSALPGGSTQAFAAPEAPAPAVPQTPIPTAAEQALSGAKSLRDAEKYDDALAAARETRNLARQTGDTAIELRALLEIGKNLTSVKKSEEALQIYAEAIPMARQLGDAPVEAIALNRRGFLLSRENPAAAARDFEDAWKLWASLGDHGDKEEAIRSLNNLGAMQLQMGDFTQALRTFEQAVTLAGQTRYPGEAGLLNGLGAVYTRLGDSERAFELFRRAQKLARDLTNTETEASATSNLGLLHQRRGELREALTAFQASLAINHNTKDYDNAAKVLSLLGVLYLDLGEPAKALEHYGEALEVHCRLGDKNWESITLTNMGKVYLVQGDGQSAMERFERALEIGLAQKEGSEQAAARALHGIGMAELALGRPAEAVRAFEGALPWRRGGDRLGEATTWLKLGEAYKALGDLDRATSQMARAEDLARKLGASFVHAEALLGLARIARDRDDLLEAQARIEEARHLLEAARSNVAGDGLRSSFFATRRPYYEFYVDLLMRLEERDPGQGYAAQAFAASEFARARSLLDLLAEGRLDLTRGVDPELKRQEREITARLNQIQDSLIQERAKTQPNEGALAVLLQRLKATEDEREQLEHKIITENPLYAQIRYPKPLTLYDVQQHLDAKTALLEYFVGTEGSYLFAVTRDGLLVRRLPDQVTIEREVEEIRQRLRRVETETFRAYTRQAHQLYQTLVAPAGALIAGKRRLLIAADGGLQLLPFEALLTARSNRPAAELPYLLRDQSISYIPSASVLSWLGKPRTSLPEGERALRLVAFADPVYGSEGAEGPQRLEGTEREVAEIEGLYPKEEVLVFRREQATEANVSAGSVSRAERIHIASHGYFDPKRPEYSGLWLTRTDGTDDGLLRVYEIFGLDLNADLVVLSACETGLGQRVTGEGLVGITRAFLYAGTPSVVVSLWQVSDTSAPLLMPSFYRTLDETGDKAEALRRAKLAMIEKKRFAHPAHWAPFILIGRPDSVSP